MARQAKSYDYNLLKEKGNEYEYLGSQCGVGQQACHTESLLWVFVQQSPDYVVQILGILRRQGFHFVGQYTLHQICCRSSVKRHGECTALVDHHAQSPAIDGKGVRLSLDHARRSVVGRACLHTRTTYPIR